jgi:hypothetical protein
VAAWPFDSLYAGEEKTQGTAEDRARAYIERALRYANRWNHFQLRNAGEVHLLDGWHKVVSVALTSCKHELLQQAQGTEDELRLLRVLLEATASKICSNPSARATALEHLGDVMLEVTSLLWTVSLRHVGTGLPNSALSLENGKRVLELIIKSLLRRQWDEAGTGARGAITTSTRYRTSLYGALILFLRATSGPAVAPERPTGPALSGLVGPELQEQRRNLNVHALGAELPDLLEVLVEDAVFSEGGGGARVGVHQTSALAALAIVLDSIMVGVDDEIKRTASLGFAAGRQNYRTGVAHKALDLLIRREHLARLLKDLDPLFCDQARGGMGMGGARGDEMGMEVDDLELDYSGAFKNFIWLMVQVARHPAGTKTLLEHKLVERVGRFKFLSRLEDPEMPNLDDRTRGLFLDQLGASLRLLHSMITAQPRNAELAAEIMQFLLDHSNAVRLFIDDRLTKLRGLDDVGVVVALLEHTDLREQQHLYRRLVAELFERFGGEMLPPVAVEQLGAPRDHACYRDPHDDNDVPG